jgi:HNH endonuclease
MTISAKTRKELWGKSGNKCAICKRELVIDSDNIGKRSIIGEECHIISDKKKGPRYQENIPRNKIDSYENLILLCNNDHKKIDDKPDVYTIERLYRIKLDHENLISNQLHNNQHSIKIRRLKENIPKYLPRLVTGKDVLNILRNSFGYSFDHDELNNQKEVDAISNFFKAIEYFEFIESESDIIHFEFSLKEYIAEIEDLGFYIFGAKEIQLMEGGHGPPHDWPIAIIEIRRKDNALVV